MAITPTTLAVASLAVAAAGTAATVYGQVQAGQAASKQAAYQAQVARNNQTIAEQRAKDAEDRGKVAESDQRRKTQQILGAQRASMAAQGFTIDEGSPVDILGDTAMFGELDALTIRSNAEREAHGYRAQGLNFEAEGGLASLRGEAAQSAAMIGATGSLLTGAGSMGNSYYKYQYGNQPAWPQS